MDIKSACTYTDHHAIEADVNHIRRHNEARVITPKAPITIPAPASRPELPVNSAPMVDDEEQNPPPLLINLIDQPIVPHPKLV